MNSIDLSANQRVEVVIPAFKEATRVASKGEEPGLAIDSLLSDLTTYFDLNNPDSKFRVRVFDDGSKDGTRELVEGHGIDVLTHEDNENHGKGAALRLGMLSILGSMPEEDINSGIIGFVDADGQLGPEVLRDLTFTVQNGADIAIARRNPEQMASFRRRASHWLAHKILERYAPTGLDTQAGAVVFSARAALSLWDKVTIDGYVATAEVLYLAKEAGYRIEEVDAYIKNVGGSRVNLIRDGIKLIKDAKLIKQRHGKPGQLNVMASQSLPATA